MVPHRPPRLKPRSAPDDYDNRKEVDPDQALIDDLFDQVKRLIFHEVRQQPERIKRKVEARVFAYLKQGRKEQHHDPYHLDDLAQGWQENFGRPPRSEKQQKAEAARKARKPVPEDNEQDTDYEDQETEPRHTKDKKKSVKKRRNPSGLLSEQSKGYIGTWYRLSEWHVAVVRWAIKRHAEQGKAGKFPTANMLLVMMWLTYWSEPKKQGGHRAGPNFSVLDGGKIHWHLFRLSKIGRDVLLTVNQVRRAVEKLEELKIVETCDWGTAGLDQPRSYGKNERYIRIRWERLETLVPKIMKPSKVGRGGKKSNNEG